MPSLGSMLDLGVPWFIERDYSSLADAGQLLGLLRALPAAAVSPADLLLPHDGRLAQRFRDPRLRAMFTFQDLCALAGGAQGRGIGTQGGGAGALRAARP